MKQRPSARSITISKNISLLQEHLSEQQQLTYVETWSSVIETKTRKAAFAS
jgi:hypothetical protein